MAALAPSNIFATAIMLLMRQSAIQTMCATLPYLMRTISKSVWASGIRILHAIPNTAKNTIMGEHLEYVVRIVSRTSRTGSHSPSSKPERTRNAVVISYESTSQHRRTPQPA